MRDGSRKKGRRAGDPLRVLFVSPCVPWPANRGGRVRTAALLSELGRSHALELWCVREPGASLPPPTAFGGGLRRVRVFERSPGPWLSTTRWRHADPERWFASRGLRRALAQADRDANFDLIHFDEPCLIRPHGGGRLRTPRVVHHHKLDVDVALQSSAIGLGPGPRELHRLRAMEAASVAATPHHITASGVDATALGERHGSLRAVPIPCGIDPGRFADVRRSRGDGDPPRVLLFGSLDYTPNVDALEFALRGPWPRLLESHPKARLEVMGSGESEEVEALCRASVQVDFLGEVEDPRPILARADLLFAPHRIGSGTRLKILEALACGCPVVATPRAAEGLDLDPERHIILGRGADELLGGMLAALADPRRARKQAEAGREYVHRNFAWGALATELERAWSDAAGIRVD